MQISVHDLALQNRSPPDLAWAEIWIWPKLSWPEPYYLLRFNRTWHELTRPKLTRAWLACLAWSAFPCLQLSLPSFPDPPPPAGGSSSVSLCPRLCRVSRSVQGVRVWVRVSSVRHVSKSVSRCRGLWLGVRGCVGMRGSRSGAGELCPDQCQLLLVLISLRLIYKSYYYYYFYYFYYYYILQRSWIFYAHFANIMQYPSSFPLHQEISKTLTHWKPWRAVWFP